jgi:prepilin signal peptidase PulO-like enzyme (type II secretory pathway)
MTAFIGVIGFIFGIIVGSFLNVVALRYNTGRSLNGRSSCFSCGKTLGAKQLVPVFSWLMQKGRCMYCSCRISPYYLAGELLTGVGFALIALRFVFFDNVPWLNYHYLVGTLFLWLLASVLIVIFLYDLRHKIIPDRLSFGFSALAFASLFFFGFSDGVFTYVGFQTPDWSHVWAGILIPIPFVLIWMFSKGRLIGLGDPKLMIGMGLLLGMQRGISAVMLSFWLGAATVLLYMLVMSIRNKTLSMKSRVDIMKIEIPFAPFLITSLFIVAVSGLNFFSLL